ncbi:MULTISPECIES: type II toxin-antitoxin system CcdA family antitoxin [Ciceribacter]|uniref:type II toxin-antitoxin system CcdA family antitoxin n=1 Tax=Ciceribacter TaxID=1648508 RepID=UPI000DF2BCF0|nr:MULTISPECIES: type II toxin-antitoxin system CcdA family antitoxin [Ciceribacter]MCO6179028.1 type II toxin-antitoxin system CcdA family antitoxin [Ciceribacter sp. RN22]
MPKRSAPQRPPSSLLNQAPPNEARSRHVTLSETAEAAPPRAVATATAERWRRENADALASSNAWASQNGLPLDRYRRF